MPTARLKIMPDKILSRRYFARPTVQVARSLIGTKDEAAIKEAEGLLMDAIRLEPENAFAWNRWSR